MTNFDPSTIYGLIIPIFILIGYYYGRFVVLKTLLDTFRVCIDSIDDAVKDNNVSEDQFRKIWDECYVKLTAFLPMPPKKPPVAPAETQK